MKNTNDATNELETICKRAIEEKYPESAWGEIEKRLDEELAYIDQTHSAERYLKVLNILEVTSAKPGEYCLLGTINASVITFLTGMSQFDPVLSDPTLYKEFCFGRTGNREPYFYISAASESYDNLKEYFLNHSCRDFAEVMPANDSERDTQEEEFDDIMTICKPESFADLVKCFGIFYGGETWKGNEREMLVSGEIGFEELIGNREDLYELLMQYGVGSDDAFRITEYVRKGKAAVTCNGGFSKTDEDLLREHNIPAWVYRFCHTAKYIPSRAGMLEYVSEYIQRTSGIKGSGLAADEDPFAS